MLSAHEAINRLKDGNQRYAAGEGGRDLAEPSQRMKLADGQKPYAIILGCADSRVPAELVFDQSLGELFVVRVAGNIVTPSIMGSVEFAAANFGSVLVVVLGHSMCGAVKAALAECKSPGGEYTPSLLAIIEKIQPTVAPLASSSDPKTNEELVTDSVRANVMASVKELGENSPILKEKLAANEIKIVGAEYSLKSGLVEFFADC